jgi:serine/threonine protein kinase
MPQNFILICFRQYIAPEYLQKGEISSRADMYNLGVLILEIVTGEKMSPQNEENLYSATLYADNVRQTYLISNIFFYKLPSIFSFQFDRYVKTGQMTTYHGITHHWRLVALMT